MGLLLADAQATVALFVKDTAPFLSVGDDQKAIEFAIDQLNRDLPLTTVSDVPGDGTQDYRLPAAFIKGISNVSNVESPAGQTPIVLKTRIDDWFLYEDPTFLAGQQQRLRFNLSTPSFSNILEALDVDTILYQSSNGAIRYTFNGSPDLSGIVVNSVLFAESSTNANNDGSYYISAVNNGSNFVEVTNDLRSDDSLDEASDSPSTVKLRTVETIRINFNGLHFISTTESSLNQSSFNAVCYLATSLLLYSLSNFMNESVNRQINADSVDYAIKAQNYRISAKDFEDKYKVQVGLKGNIKPAQALVEADIKFMHGEDFIFHPSLQR
jgi:hypothetical protein